MNPAAFHGPAIGPVPVEFILFACVLAGVALFHHHTLRTALGGAIVIALYKIVFSPFKTGAGVSGFGSHLLSRVGDPDQPAAAVARLCAAGQALRGHRDTGGAAALAARRLEGLLRAAGAGVRVVELSRQHRRRDDRRRDRAHRVQGQGARRLPGGDRGRVQRRRRGQRGGRHHDDDDVDRRHPPAGGARGLHRIGRGAGAVRHPGVAAAATLLADSKARRTAPAGRLGFVSASWPSSWWPPSWSTWWSTPTSTRCRICFRFSARRCGARSC